MRILSGYGIKALAKTQAQLSAPYVPPAWDPNDQAGLILDLDANTLASMFTDLAKTTNPTDGQQIKVWSDQDGKAIDFAEVLAAENPHYRANVGGYPAVDFSDAAQERHLRTTALSSTAGEYTEYTVVDPRTITSGVHSRVFDTQTGRLILALNGGLSSVDSLSYFDVDRWVEAPGADLLPIEEPCILTWKLAAAGGEVYRQIGGVNTLKISGAYTPRNYGGQTVIGRGQSGGATTARAYIYQHLVYEGIHDAGQMAAIRAGLVAKFSGLGL
jgi:hypothetical protein